MPTYKNRDGADVTAAQLSDEDLLNLTTHNRDKALAELAAKGHHLVAVIVDVSAHCPNELCMDGRVRISEDVVVDCPDCDGAGHIDARPVCTDPGCIEQGHRYQATGYECARVHAHGARPLPLDVEPPGYRGPNPGRGPRVELEIIDEVSPVTDAVFAKIAGMMPQQDADPYPWDEPIPPEAYPWGAAPESLEPMTAEQRAAVTSAIREWRQVPPTPAELHAQIGLDTAKIFRALEPVAPAIEDELRATALVSDLNTKIGALGVNARAERTPGAITITISGDTSLADVEAIAELLVQAVSSWPGERPHVTGRVETDEARFVTPADLAAVVAVPESSEPPDEPFRIRRPVGSGGDLSIAERFGLK